MSWGVTTDEPNNINSRTETSFNNAGFSVAFAPKGLGAIPWYVWAAVGVAAAVWLIQRKRR